MTLETINLISDRIIFAAFALLAGIALVRLPWASLWRWSADVSPAVIDGLLYSTWAMFTAVLANFSSEEAYKYVDPWVLFYLKAILGSVAAGLGALKAFRSQSYRPDKDKPPTP